MGCSLTHCRALGTALDWPEAKQRAQQVRQWGILQLLEIWNKAKGKERDALLWGDEVSDSFCLNALDS
jgi:glutamate--cysteine ligase catalytic subunit